MIGNNLLTDREEIPLNISKVMWKDFFITGTKVQVNYKEMSGIPVTKTKATTGAKNNKERMFINLKIQFNYPKINKSKLASMDVSSS